MAGAVGKAHASASANPKCQSPSSKQRLKFQLPKDKSVCDRKHACLFAPWILWIGILPGIWKLGFLGNNIAAMFFKWRLCSDFTIFAAAAPLLFVASSFSAHARQRGELVLATSADDPALRTRLVALSPGVNPDEARRVTSIAYTTGRELAREWRMGASPTVHSFLINIGLKKKGYCYHFAEELLLRLDAQKLQTLELHWAESDAGTDTEHNVIVVTGRGQPFEQGIMLDNWRHSGHLLWGPITGDPVHTWQENKAAFNRRLNRAATSNSKRGTKPKPGPSPQSTIGAPRT